MLASRKLVAALSLVIACTSPVSGADQGNWMRDYVAERESEMMRRVLGRRTAVPDLSSPRIIGGGVAPAERWPFQVGLLNAAIADNAQAQFCGGSLVRERHVVTAAHCVDFLTAPQLHVLTGTTSLATGGARHGVEAIAIHPDWNPSTSDFDIAVVTLAEPVSGIPFAKLITPEKEMRLATTGTKALVAGWGDTQPGFGSTFPTELHQVKVPLVARSVCNGWRSYRGAVTQQMICAGLPEGGKDSCQGDSGGPLVVKNANGIWKLQVGIVSWGIGCALPNLYGVYARVAVLNAWAQSVIDASP